MLEYRRTADNFESSLPGTGVLIYRINTNYSGNADYDGTNTFDEVYVFRPGANNMTNDGQPDQAYFGVLTRTSFNSQSNPRPFLTGGAYYNDLNITNITLHGATAEFTLNGPAYVPLNFMVDSVTQSSVSLSWKLNQSNSVVLIAANQPITDTLVSGTSYVAGTILPNGAQVLYLGSDSSFVHSGLQVASYHYYQLISNINQTNTWSAPVSLQASTACGVITRLPYIESFEQSTNIPVCMDEAYLSGSCEWQIKTDERSSTDIAGAYDGSNYLWFHQNDYSHPVTQLITPEMNFSDYLSNTICLSFWYASPKWSNDQDKLKILYRTSANGSWMLLDSLVEDITQWSYKEYTLPQSGSFYQIAFEGEANYGYGVMLDDIQINADSVQVVCNSLPTQGGSVSGAGKYEALSAAMLNATPNVGYAFCGWSDGINDNPRTIVVNQDTTLQALFCRLPNSQITVDNQTVCENQNVNLSVTPTDSIYWFNGTVEMVEYRNVPTIQVSPAVTSTYSSRCVNVEQLANRTVWCADTSSTTITVYPVYNTPTIYASVALGQVYNDNGWAINTADSLAGSYALQRIEQTIHGCDSVLNLQLHVLNNTTVLLYDTICDTSLPYTWNGQLFTQGGTRVLNLKAVNDADSVVIMNLIVNTSSHESIIQNLCENELPYQWNGFTLDALNMGPVIYTTQGATGCDSIVELTLNLYPSYQIDTIIAAEAPVQWQGSIYTESGIYQQTLSTINECDSILTLHLTISLPQGVDESMLQSALVVYPNPVKQFVMLDCSETIVNQMLVLTNHIGQVVKTQLVTEQPLQVDLHQLPTGIYFLRIGRKVCKVIKL